MRRAQGDERIRAVHTQYSYETTINSEFLQTNGDTTETGKAKAKVYIPCCYCFKEFCVNTCIYTYMCMCVCKKCLVLKFFRTKIRAKNKKRNKK